MKRLYLLIVLLFNLQPASAFNFRSNMDMSYWDKTDYSNKADNWYNRYVRYLSGSSRTLLAKYAACRIQEINSWLCLERKSFNKFENKIARIQYKDALERKRELEIALSRYSETAYALDALRREAKLIAENKFTSEVIASFFEYKSGKRAAAKTAKMSFYTYCWSLLEIY